MALTTPMIKLKVKANNQLISRIKEELIDKLDPDGTTKIEIITEVKAKIVKEGKMAVTEIEVPEIYKQTLNFVFYKISVLPEDANIIFKINQPSKCLFCNEQSGSSEHIFPKWIIPFVPKTILIDSLWVDLTNRPMEEVISNPMSNLKKVPSDNYTIDCVCTKCNNGWMSRLESEVKSVLLKEEKLIEVVPKQINSDQALNLSKWLVLKSLLILNKQYPNAESIPLEVYQSISKGTIDNELIIEYLPIMPRESRLFFTIMTGINHELILIEKNRKQAFISDSLELTVCIIQVGKLVFRVSYLPSDSTLKRNSGVIKSIQLHPLNAPIPHRSTIKDEEVLKMIQRDNVEVDFLGFAGISLTEKGK